MRTIYIDANLFFVKGVDEAIVIAELKKKTRPERTPGGQSAFQADIARP